MKPAGGAALLSLWMAVPIFASAAAPDLTSKRVLVTERFTHNLRDQSRLEEPVTWELALVFEAGKPGSPVSATWINPQDLFIKWCDSKTFVGSYSAAGDLDIKLYCKHEGLQIGLGNFLKLRVNSSGVLSGEAKFFTVFGGMQGEASGECVGCGSAPTEVDWAPGAALAALAVYVVYALSQPLKRPPVDPPAAPRVRNGDDPNDPWKDLPKTQRVTKPPG